jgi:hypothetical protein
MTFQQHFFPQPVLIPPGRNPFALRDGKFGLHNEIAVGISIGWLWLDAKNDRKDLLDFEGCSRLGRPETIFGGDELGEYDCLSDVFGGIV